MASNELKVCEFIFNNKNLLNLRHLGKIYEIATPVKGSSEIKIIQDVYTMFGCFLLKQMVENSPTKLNCFLGGEWTKKKERKKTSLVFKILYFQ